MLNELRQDPFTKRWVIIAKGRAKRPKDVRPHLPPKTTEQQTCVLCPGQEHQSKEIFRIGKGKPGTPGWEVRGVLNKAPYFETKKHQEPFSGREIFKKAIPAGTAEVLVETPHHKKELVFLSGQELEKVLLAYQIRYEALKQKWGEVSIFRNHGFLAGQSLAHPHTQILATLNRSPENKKEELNSIEYFYGHDSCVYCDVITAELAKKECVVFQNNSFVAVCPWASQKPYEVIIFPRRHAPNFDSITMAEIRDLATPLQEILQKMYTFFGDPDYNFYIRSFSPVAPLSSSTHWYLRIIFHLSIAGGYEASSSSFVNPMPPEEAAKILRRGKNKVNWQQLYKNFQKD